MHEGLGHFMIKIFQNGILSITEKCKDEDEVFLEEENRTKYRTGF